MSAQAEWAQRPERGSRWILRFMVWLSLTIGRRISRLLLPPIALWFFLLAPAARRASAAYRARVLGRAPTLAERFGHFYAFACVLHDRLYFLQDRQDLFDFTLTGEAALDCALADGRGALLFGAHLGSFEAIRALSRTRPGLKVALAMYEKNAQKINAALNTIATPDARPEIIPLGRLESMLQIRDRLNDGVLVGVLADRSLGDEPCACQPVLDAPAALPVGPFRMAAMLSAKVVFMAGLYLGDNRYAVRFAPIADFSDTPRTERSAQITAAQRAYADEITSCCQTAPDNWFNFFDFWQEK
jgi:predicted LPLAT superfamily acyltransferase